MSRNKGLSAFVLPHCLQMGNRPNIWAIFLFYKDFLVAKAQVHLDFWESPGAMMLTQFVKLPPQSGRNVTIISRAGSDLMKPITDDVVHSLLQGIAVREKSNRRAERTQKNSAKVIEFAVPHAKCEVVAMQGQTSRRTMSGVFCYVSRLRGV
ncbi:MAG: hypothetical protein HKN27_11085 [Silicimonas sp.]|nr:hypothetical protein [Silicimonas sp.]